MAINYADSAKQIVELIGGDSNVISVTHCATRLRFVLKEMGRVDKEVLKRVQGVITVIESSGQLQVVIGNHVGDAYREVQKRVQIDENAVVDAPKVGMVNHLMDIISSIFAPFLYPLAACGVLQGLISFFAAIGWMDTTSFGRPKICPGRLTTKSASLAWGVSRQGVMTTTLAPAFFACWMTFSSTLLALQWPMSKSPGPMAGVTVS